MRSLRSLEWERIKAYTAAEALSPVAREYCLDLPLETDSEVVDNLLCQTEEARFLVENGADPVNDRIPDLRRILATLSAGARLTVEELNQIKDVLAVSRKVSASLRLLSKDDFPKIASFGERITVLDDLRRELDSSLDEKGGIKDSASTELAAIRKSIRKLHADIKDELGRLIHSSQVAKALQETIITQRNGRYVLPVSASKRNSVNGIVHDTSQSGLTVYIEPISIVEPSNRIRILETEEVREIERIIDALCLICREKAPVISSNFEILTELDVIQAKARVGIKYGGIKPEISRDDRIELIESRHPLLVLQGGAVVANSLSLGGAEKKRTLVITGPNTGGKTVLLKQVGLVALMLKAGMLIPGLDRTKLPIFECIWSDIGDEQSLEQSLSTFSSHLQNIVTIAESARPGVLILLDEIGVGTDPSEGAAIARAVLEHLNASGALTVTTTHYTDLKLLAYSEEGFVNGSLEFNEATFAPTYKLRLGVPGSSKGIVIARRLGLSPAVVERATNLIELQGEDLARVMTELEARLSEILEKEKALQNEFDRQHYLAESLEAAKSDFDRKKSRLVEEYRANLSRGLEDAEEKIRSLTRELQSQPSLKKTQAMKDKLAELKRELDWLEETPPGKGKEKFDPASLSRGDRVRVLSLNQPGTVEEVISSNGDQYIVSVLVGTMKVKVPVRDLAPLADAVSSSGSRGHLKKRLDRGKRAGSPSPVVPARELEEFIRTSTNTLDLRGKRVEEALTLVEQFLDGALISGMSPLMVIHGHGTGAIKRAVREYMKSSRYVRSYRSGEMHEGGDGVTVIDVK